MVDIIRAIFVRARAIRLSRLKMYQAARRQASRLTGLYVATRPTSRTVKKARIRGRTGTGRKKPIIPVIGSNTSRSCAMRLFIGPWLGMPAKIWRLYAATAQTKTQSTDQPKSRRHEHNPHQRERHPDPNALLPHNQLLCEKARRAAPTLKRSSKSDSIIRLSDMG